MEEEAGVPLTEQDKVDDREIAEKKEEAQEETKEENTAEQTEEVEGTEDEATEEQETVEKKVEEETTEEQEKVEEQSEKQVEEREKVEEEEEETTEEQEKAGEKEKEQEKKQEKVEEEVEEEEKMKEKDEETTEEQEKTEEKVDEEEKEQEKAEEQEKEQEKAEEKEEETTEEQEKAEDKAEEQEKEEEEEVAEKEDEKEDDENANAQENKEKEQHGAREVEKKKNEEEDSKKEKNQQQAASSSSSAAASSSYKSPELPTERNVKTAFKSKYLIEAEKEAEDRNIAPECKAFYIRMKYQKAFGVDTWAKGELEKHTFPTKMFTLSYEEAEALVSKSKEDREAALLQQLQEKIEEAAAEYRETGFFIKFDTRSPKDVPVYDFDNPTVQKLVTDCIEAIPAEQLQSNRANAEMIAFVKATNLAMKLCNGEQAMDLLLRSSRIKEDLSRQLQFPKEYFDMNVIVRQWVEEVVERPQYEFRGFVHNDKLNALTQYFSFSYFPELVERRSEIEQRIREFHGSVAHLIEHNSYVIDFYLTGDNRVLIIELNPFHTGAGAGLFKWATDRERFLNGPFVMRIVEEMPKTPDDVMPLRWRRWIDSKQLPPPNLDISPDDLPPEPHPFCPNKCSIL